MRSVSSIALAVSLATVINAQTPDLSSFNISDGCASALLDVASGENSNCLNLSALLGVVTNPTQSIITPVTNWLNQLCSVEQCSDDTINQIYGNVAQACSNEATSWGIPLDDNSRNMVRQWYPALREAVCLKDTGADQFCAVEVLNDYQDTYGTLSLSNAAQLWSQVASSPPASNITCTPCSKALYTRLREEDPETIPEVTTCGEEFNDGQMPEGVQLAAEGSGETPGGGASGLYDRAVLLAGIPAILAVSALLT